MNDIKQATCTHEPDLTKRYYHPKGWRAPCAKCGVTLGIQPHLQAIPHTPKVHMSKKKRLAIRRGQDG